MTGGRTTAAVEAPARERLVVGSEPGMSETEGKRALRARVAQLELERAQLEEQLRTLHRAKTTMDLIGGVAHDLAAALTGVVWCSQALASLPVS